MKTRVLMIALTLTAPLAPNLVQAQDGQGLALTCAKGSAQFHSGQKILTLPGPELVLPTVGDYRVWAQDDQHVVIVSRSTHTQFMVALFSITPDSTVTPKAPEAPPSPPLILLDYSVFDTRPGTNVGLYMSGRERLVFVLGGCRVIRPRDF
jgi:hypothetical protein